MWPFRNKRTTPIRVNVTVRVFVDGKMARLSRDTTLSEGARLKDLLKQLRREGALDTSVVRYVLKEDSGVMVLQNGHRLSMPRAASARLADGDMLSVLTTMAGG